MNNGWQVGKPKKKNYIFVWECEDESLDDEQKWEIFRYFSKYMVWVMKFYKTNGVLVYFYLIGGW